MLIRHAGNGADTMRDTSLLLLTAGLVCGVLGIAWHLGLLAVVGVAMLVAGLLLRSLAPRRPAAYVERPRFGPTTVASTVAGGRGKPFDMTPRD